MKVGRVGGTARRRRTDGLRCISGFKAESPGSERLLVPPTSLTVSLNTKEVLVSRTRGGHKQGGAGVPKTNRTRMGGSTHKQSEGTKRTRQEASQAKTAARIARAIAKRKGNQGNAGT